MLFPTIDFAVFFLVVFAVAWSSLRLPRARTWFLIIASYYFYAFWDIRFAFLLGGCSILNYLFGALLGLPELERYRKITLWTGVVTNLAILGFFKYFDFFTGSFNNMLMALGLPAHLPVLNIILPVGVSFFTFQGVSYVVDVYRRDIEASWSIADVLLYISFFPQLVAGPIVRAAHFLPQLKSTPDPEKIEASKGITLIMLGLFKKVVIANYLSTEIVQPIFADPAMYGTVDALIGIYAYAVQLYCDFSAYSDIAIGVAALLGYHFPMNFNQPYRAENLQDFWRRWHISLSSWLRDYLYKPLGGSKHGGWRTRFNMFMVMFLAGLWHGAAWTFVVFGIIHGLWLVTEKEIRDRIPKDILASPLARTIGVLITFHFICFSLMFFAADSLSTTWEYFVAFTNVHISTQLVSPLVLLLIWVGLIGNFVPKTSLQDCWDLYADRPLVVQAAIIGFLLIMLGSMGPKGIAPFIYYQF